ncbi:hypothetical protein AgCh_019695 [Apium graveolens]
MHYLSGLTSCQNIVYQTSPQGENREKAQVGDCILGWISSQQMISSGMIVDVGATSVGPMGFEDLQSLSLSMSLGSQSSCVTASRKISPSGTVCLDMETKKRGSKKMSIKQPAYRKSLDAFGYRTSRYRGITSAETVKESSPLESFPNPVLASESKNTSVKVEPELHESVMDYSKLVNEQDPSVIMTPQQDQGLRAENTVVKTTPNHESFVDAYPKLKVKINSSDAIS